MIDIDVYKNFLSNEDMIEIHETIKTASWSYGTQSNGNGNGANKFWILSSLEEKDFFSKYLFQKIVDVTKKSFEYKRIYMNGHTFGNHGNIHTDSMHLKSYTFLIYCNEYWHPEFGGETKFIIDDEVKSIYPEPKSAILFPGYIEHFSGPLSHSFTDLRVTLAYKLYEL